MTGREAPKRRELEHNLARRMFDASTIRVGHAGAAPSKRFSRPGQVMDLATVQSKKWTVLNDGLVPATGNEDFVAHLANQLIGGKKKGAAKKGAAGAAGTAAATGAAAANGTADAASGTTARGFSPVAAAAQAKGGLTDANTPNTKDALGLDIEYVAPLRSATARADAHVLGRTTLATSRRSRWARRRPISGSSWTPARPTFGLARPTTVSTPARRPARRTA
jgi:hypothetical protein